MPEKPEKPLFRQLLKASTVGIQLVVSTFVGLAIGWLLDYKLFKGKTAPYLTIIFLIIGIVSGFRDLVRLARQGDGDNKKTL